MNFFNSSTQNIKQNYLIRDSIESYSKRSNSPIKKSSMTYFLGLSFISFFISIYDIVLYQAVIHLNNTI